MSALHDVNKAKLLGVSVLRLGDHGDNKRIWVVNKLLGETFVPGEPVQTVYDKKNRMMRVKRVEFFGDTHTISSRGNGTPILDIKNKEVGDTLGYDIEKIEVLFYENELIIKVSKTEEYKKQRKEKVGVNTFEFFSGSGVLSYFFKNSGFNIVGGLELNPDYQALFHTNHEGDEIYSITGYLEDIHISYFPKNVQVGIAGIPCDNFTNANLSLNKAKKAKAKGEEYDEEKIGGMYEAEALTFYLLTAVRAMNLRTLVVEEVPGYSQTSASHMLRTVLKQMGYHITETVATGTVSKRKRWVLVADMVAPVSLENLVPESNVTLEEFLEASLEEREWIPGDESKRVQAMRRKIDSVGERFMYPEDTRCNVFTKHSTRSSEPILKKSGEEDLFSEFTNREIARIHGIGDDFILDPRKTFSREILGQGVCDTFKFVAERIMDSYKQNVMPKKAQCA